MTSLYEHARACVDSEYSSESLTVLANALTLALNTTARPRFLELENQLGRDPLRMIGEIRDAADPLVRRDAAKLLAALSDNCACSGEEPPEPTYAQEDEAIQSLGKRAVAPVIWAIEQTYLS